MLFSSEKSFPPQRRYELSSEPELAVVDPAERVVVARDRASSAEAAAWYALFRRQSAGKGSHVVPWPFTYLHILVLHNTLANIHMLYYTGVHSGSTTMYVRSERA